MIWYFVTFYINGTIALEPMDSELHCKRHFQMFYHLNNVRPARKKILQKAGCMKMKAIDSNFKLSWQGTKRG